MISKTMFRDAMAGLGASVNVITTDGAAGKAGCTASAVCAVTDEPPTLLVCINRASRNNAVIRENGRLCVNVLSAEQQHVAMRFSTKDLSLDERFACAEWEQLDTGAPVLSDALSALDCDIESSVEVGTHTVFFCTIKAARAPVQGEGLIYFARDFHRVGNAMAALATAQG
ncbi:flavin reductase [Paraburkholderia sp. ZP32-5]|uniref:flavin reductase n=1 Tax=Paraburkholderia sp. ZP32-5 TaxID=2883245 RepID=UPI001F18C410|nr:flavin reductase [Paraburkholderia sp. ZP32-5]